MTGGLAEPAPPPSGRSKRQLQAVGAIAEARALPWVLVAVLVVAVTVAAVSRAHLGTSLTSARGDLSAARHEVAAERARNDALTAGVSHWKSEADRWHRQSRYYQLQVKAVHGEISQTIGSLSNPIFSLWNSCDAKGPKAGCRLTPGYEYIGGVPDTFTYRLKFHATVPVTVRILSVENFVCYETRNCAWHGPTWENRKTMDVTFRDAEGCAGYFAVFTSERPGTLYPDVWVTRNPAIAPTGVCSTGA